MSEQLFFNGINATTGEPLLPPITSDLLASIITREEHNVEQEKELAIWWEQYASPNAPQHLRAVEGTDYKDLSSAGWGVIFPFDVDDEIVDALRPLLDWRKSQAGERYREYRGPDGYRYKPEDDMFESKNDWLTRHGMGPGPADPEKVPYYLLLVGDPDTIPYRFQSQLDVQYAVGRIHFDTPEEYANYANSVVTAEKKKLSLGKNATFFGVANPDDPATNMSIEQLVGPLAQNMPQKSEGWRVESVLRDQATKDHLAGLLGREQSPALLFTASHGMGFPNGHPLQLVDQGGLLCQDWPGPNQWRKPIGKDFYFAADDLPADANVFGMVAFIFACYGAGTPQLDEFARIAFKRREAIASNNFIAKLPQRLLGHPNGGALAFIGHVERAWGYSFSWGKAGAQLAVFESALKRLMDGYPVGYAFEYFNERYAELSSDLSVTLEEMEFGKRVEAMELAGMWTANNDARNYVVLGDPFVKLMV
ncbi:MAG: hypothetical protein JW963_07290 [Anaerolineales bacterium]|nr:hypothetical protein [Anaerolineales bacterium]